VQERRERERVGGRENVTESALARKRKEKRQQHTTVHCTTQHHVATYCTAPHCTTLHHLATYLFGPTVAQEAPQQKV